MEYTLEIKKDESCSFEGSVLIDVPNMVERLEIIRDASTKEGELSSQLDEAISSVKVAKKKIVSLNLVHTSGKKFESIDDLLHYKEGAAIVYKVAAIVMNGIPLGNG